MLNNNKNSDFCAPLTSFDWNEVDPNLLGTSSIDTTCTIWYFDYFLTFLSLIGEGSGCSTVVEHRPTEQNSLGYELIPSGCWAFFCSFYPSVLHPESGSSWRCNTTYCLSQKNRCVQLDMHRFGKKIFHMHICTVIYPYSHLQQQSTRLAIRMFWVRILPGAGLFLLLSVFFYFPSTLQSPYKVPQVGASLLVL